MARSDRGDGFESVSRPGGSARRDANQPKAAKTSAKGVLYVDYKDTETLRRCMSANGKLNGRRRNSSNAMVQRLIARAVKRARFMALLPYVETSS